MSDRERLLDIAKDAEAALFGLDEAIEWFGHTSRMYPQLRLARSVCERIWLSACAEVSPGPEQEVAEDE